jgi:predicted nuclease of predicted toxin-antitoxin system
MKFFFDHNLSPALVLGLRGFGEDVVHLTENFPADTEDVVWLEHVGREGWVLVTRDQCVRKNPAELSAIRQYRVGTFFLGGKNRKRCEIIQQLVRNWPRIKEYAARLQPPYAFIVPPSGCGLKRI